MTIKLSDDQVRQLRLSAQRLALEPGEGTPSVARVVRDLCGIQAQEAPAAALAIRVRSRGLVAADVERASVQERTTIRTWGLRGTLHLLATEDLDWLLPLLGTVFIAGDRRRREELGLDEETCARGLRVLRDVLANRAPLTRAEIVEQMAAHGIRLEGQAAPHLLARAALEGILCLGPERGGKPTYVLLSDWIGAEHRGSPLPEEAAHAELARRYLAAYAPATPQDQAAWSGMPLSKTRLAWGHLANQLIEVEVAGASAWLLKQHASRLDEPAAAVPNVRLLPRFDVYLLGYQTRDLAVPPQYAKRINAGGGIVHPTVLVDGRTVATWKSNRKGNKLQVVVAPFDSLVPRSVPGLQVEVTDLGRFLEVQASLEIQALNPPRPAQFQE